MNFVNQLNGIISSSSPKINILSEKLNDVALVAYTELANRIDRLNIELATLKYGSIARDIGMRTDKASIHRVFPEAARSQYGLFTLAGLKAFLEDPDDAIAEGHCLSGAILAWQQVEEKEKEMIREKLKKLLCEFPGFLFLIGVLKDDWQYTHTITYANETGEYICDSEDETLVQAVGLCSKFLRENT